MKNKNHLLRKEAIGYANDAYDLAFRVLAQLEASGLEDLVSEDWEHIHSGIYDIHSELESILDVFLSLNPNPKSK